MKKILLAGVAFAALTGAASAADLPVRTAPPAPVIAAVPLFTWTGFYVGVNAGYGWNTNNNNNGFFDPATGTFFASSGSNDGGFVGGGQIGYNYQIGAFVVGAEADIQYADIGGGGNNVFGGGNNGNWFGTLRARAGVAFDRALIYATGGFAYGDIGGTRGSCFAGDVFVGCSGGSDTNTGWTLGGGVQYAIPVNWFGSSATTFGVEGLYVKLDSNNNNIFNDVAFTNRSNGEFCVVRAKLNFKFGTH